MRNYKMTISYDGTRYKGWQRLPGEENTIQGILEQVLSNILEYDVTIDGSGRTDAGVHALGQVANVKVGRKIDEGFLKSLINENLPEDIYVSDIELVPNSFHSRYSAMGKRYSYRIDCREKPHVFSRKYTYHYGDELDLESMRAAATCFLGEQNFASFSGKIEAGKSSRREIYDIKISKEKEQIKIEYYGNGFLNHMVRIMTGTLIEVGSGKKKPQDIPLIIEKKERKYAGYTAPAKGLFLEKVYYERKKTI